MINSPSRLPSPARWALLGFTFTLFAICGNAEPLVYTLQGTASGSVEQSQLTTAFRDEPFTAVYTSNAHTQGGHDLNLSAIFPLTVQLTLGSQTGTFQGALGSDGYEEIYTAPADGMGFQLFFQSSQPLTTFSKSKFFYSILDSIDSVSLTEVFFNNRLPEPFVTSLGVVDWSSFSNVTFTAAAATAAPEPSTLPAFELGVLMLSAVQMHRKLRRQ